MTRLRFATISVLALAAAGCMTPTGQTADAPGDEHPGAGAELSDARGRQVAVMEAGEQGGALYVVIDATGMAPGRYSHWDRSGNRLRRRGSPPPRRRHRARRSGRH